MTLETPLAAMCSNVKGYNVRITVPRSESDRVDLSILKPALLSLKTSTHNMLLRHGKQALCHVTLIWQPNGQWKYAYSLEFV